MDAWLVGRVLEVAAPVHRGLSLQLLVAGLLCGQNLRLFISTPPSRGGRLQKHSIVWLFLVLWAYMREIHLKFTTLPKVTLEHYIAIQTRSSVLDRYLQDGLNEPKKAPSAYWKACVQKILLF